jgi:6-phosphogluconolactonase
MPVDVAVHPVDELARRFVRLVEDASARAIAERGAFSLAIPGGSAVEVLAPSLIPASIDWAKVSIFWVDERMVPPTDPESNFRAAKAAWLDRVPIEAERIHRMRGESPAAAGAAAEYASLLREQLGESPQLDLVLLGMGTDGHVASLFPGHRLLRTWDRDVAFLEDAPKPPPRRLTLTLKALTAARSLVVFAAGRAKAEAIETALGQDESELPVALATMGHAPVTFLLDPAAGSRLAL